MSISLRRRVYISTAFWWTEAIISFDNLTNLTLVVVNLFAFREFGICTVRINFHLILLIPIIVVSYTNSITYIVLSRINTFKTFSFILFFARLSFQRNITASIFSFIKIFIVRAAFLIWNILIIKTSFISTERTVDKFFTSQSRYDWSIRNTSTIIIPITILAAMSIR